MKITLIPAKESDIGAISTMASEIWNLHYPAIIGQTQVDYMLNKMYSPEALKQQMQQGQQFFILQTEDGQQPCGYLSVSESPSSESTFNNKLFIHKFYIHPAKQKAGIGMAAFQSLLEQFPLIKEIRLQVNRQNYTAINFYFKAGFKIEQVADFDIGDGYFMNDFIMLWKKP